MLILVIELLQIKKLPDINANTEIQEKSIPASNFQHQNPSDQSKLKVKHYCQL